MKHPRLYVGGILALGAIVCSPIGIQLIMAFQVAPLPKALHPFAMFIFFVCFVFPLAWLTLALVSPPFTVIALFNRQIKPYITIAALVWLISWTSLPLARPLSSLRHRGLEKMTEKARPLIETIESYNVAEGSYPPDLQALIPRYISEIPYTGAVGYPDFEYRRPTSESLFRTYEVYVNTPSGGINFDTFVYWPEKGYPSYMYGGSIELINGWAYVHE